MDRRKLRKLYRRGARKRVARFNAAGFVQRPVWLDNARCDQLAELAALHGVTITRMKYLFLALGINACRAGVELPDLPEFPVVG